LRRAIRKNSRLIASMLEFDLDKRDEYEAYIRDNKFDI
jgi:hypothetical protein